jgi:hypothetical protein
MTKGLRLRTALSTAVVAMVMASSLAGVGVARAQTSEPMTPPAGIDAAHPTVSGILIAKPISGEGNIPAACRDRDASLVNQANLVNRGLVICTSEGKLVLLALDNSTGFFARYWGEIYLRQLADGDHINAWGTLKDHGYLLDPTRAVQDTDLQRAFTDSQDFIAGRDGRVLTLMVLKSDSGGPVDGIVHAVPGGATHVILCGDHDGTWANLTVGKTINITDSLFNRRTRYYIHTGTVRVASCP